MCPCVLCLKKQIVNLKIFEGKKFIKGDIAYWGKKLKKNFQK